MEQEKKEEEEAKAVSPLPLSVCMFVCMSVCVRKREQKPETFFLLLFLAQRASRLNTIYLSLIYLSIYLST